MGGTFDPIHHGHLVAASEVAGLFELDEVVFVPTGQPWQKSERAGQPARGPLPDDGHRDRLQPAVLGQPRRHRPRRPDVHDRHPARPARAATGRRAVLHHRRRRAGPDRQLAGRRAAVRARALHRRDPARLRPAPTRTCPRGGSAWSRCRRWRSAPPTAATGSPRACRSGTSCPTAWCSTSRSGRSTATPVAAPGRDGDAADLRPASTIAGGRRSAGPRSRPPRPTSRRYPVTASPRRGTPRCSPRRRPPTSSPPTSPSRRQRPAGHHRRLRARLGAQRAPGPGDRRRDRGAAARARHQAGAPRGRGRVPLGAARLRRHRRARAARRGAGVLRARAALEGLPDDPVRRQRARRPRQPAAPETTGR